MKLLDFATREPTPCFREPGNTWAAARTADEKFRVMRELPCEIGQLRVATALWSAPDAHPVPSTGE